MPATDLERLVVQLEATSQKLDNQITATARNIDRRLGEIEKRSELMRTRVESSFAAAGANAVKKFTNALLATGAVVAVERFVASIVTLAEGIKHTSDVTGVSTDNLQAWAIAARRAGVDSESFSTGLERFTSNFGKAKEGNKQLQAEFKRLGIDLRGDVNQALLTLSDRLHNTEDLSKRASVVTALFGRGMANLTPFISQGSGALQQWVKDLKAQGLIISSDLFPKIDEMKNKWEDLKTKLEVAAAPALIAFFDEFSKFTGDLNSPAFQNALANFAKLMAEIAATAAKLAPFLPAIAGAFVGGRLAGAPGALIGAVAGGVAGQQAGFSPISKEDQLAQLEARAAQLQRETSTFNGKPFYEAIFGNSAQTATKLKELSALEQKIREIKQEAGVTPTPKGGTPTGKGLPPNVFAPVGGDQAARLAAEAQARADAYARLRVEQARANEQQVAADDQLHVELLKGLAGYHDAVQKEIDDELEAKLKAIDEEVAAKVTALGKLKGLSKQELQDDLDAIHETAAAQRSAVEAAAQARSFENSGGAVVRDATARARELIQGYQDETDSLGKLGGELARIQFIQEAFNEAKKQDKTLTDAETAAIYKQADAVAAAAQKAHDAAKAMQDNIAVADEFRSGLEDVFAAGLKGWKAMEQAAGNFLQQMAETILKTYVLKPLLENLFGEQGTPLGGIIGEALGVGGAKGPTGKVGDPVNVHVDNLGGAGGSANPIQDLLDSLGGAVGDIGQTGGPNLSGSKSLGSTVEGGTTGASDAAKILADGMQQGGKTAATTIGDAMDTSGKSLGDLLTSVFKSGGDLLSSIFDGLGSLLGGGGGGGGGILGSLFGSLGSLFGGSAASASIAELPAELVPLLFGKGGVMTPRGARNLRRFGSGGVSQPSTEGAIFAEKGIEAAVPLPDGRSIPVTLTFPKVLAGPKTPQIIVNQTVNADRSILADDVWRKIEKSKAEAISIGSQRGAQTALKGQPARDRNFKRLGT